MDEVNQVCKQKRCGYRIRRDTSKKGSGVKDRESYSPPSLNGTPSEKVIEAAEDLLNAVYPPSLIADGRKEFSQLQRMRRQWESWRVVYGIISKLQPSDTEVKILGREVRRFAIRIVDLHDQQEANSLYIHTIVYHCQTFLAEHGSIGKFSQQAVENKHNAGKAAHRTHGFSGGVQGRRRTRRWEGPDQAGEGAAGGSSGLPASAVSDPLFVFGENSNTREKQVSRLKEYYPEAGTEWHNNYVEHSITRALLLMGFLRAVPFCVEHDSFNCTCPVFERQRAPFQDHKRLSKKRQHEERTLKKHGVPSMIHGPENVNEAGDNSEADESSANRIQAGDDIEGDDEQISVGGELQIWADLSDSNSESSQSDVDQDDDSDDDSSLN